LVVFSFVLGAIGIAGGLILAVQTDDSGFEVEYPYLGIGIGLALNAAFFAIIGVVLGKLGEAYAHSNRD
jgi:hypothetical protein